MSLTGAEWKLLHRVIDLVDERRARPVEGADVQRVKALVLDVYRDQGIGVDEAVVEQAIRDVAEPCDVGPAAEASVPGNQMGPLKKAEARWQALERDRAQARLNEHMQRDPIARLTARIDAQAAPLFAHRPMSDQALAASMAKAMVREVVSFKRMGRWRWAAAGAFMAGLGLLGWCGYVLAEAGLMGFGMRHVLGTCLGLAGLSVGLVGQAQASKARDRAGANTLALMRGQKALALQDYDSDDLKKGARIAGHIVQGSLKPLHGAGDAAGHKRATAIAGDDLAVAHAWKTWDFTYAPMRENDFLVLQRLVAVRSRHPFHSIKKLRELSQRRGQPMDGPF